MRIQIAAGLLALSIAGACQATETSTTEMPPVRVYDAGELSLDRFAVVKRLWTGTWRGSFWVPQYDDAADAISALTTKARSLGADGLTNLHCVNEAGTWGGSYLCYALAIKLK